jgi:hypothetical protein
MNKKLRSTLSLLGLLLFIVLIGAIYIFMFQRSDLNDREDKLKELNANSYDPVELADRYEQLKVRSAILDSVLQSRKFNIPKDLSSIKFYNFINNVVSNFSEHTEVNIEFQKRERAKDFFFYEYKVTGSGFYNEFFRLIYSIEQSKELKKIITLNMGNMIKTDEKEFHCFW